MFDDEQLWRTATLQSQPYSEKLAFVSAAAVASALWTAIVVRRLPAGSPRLVAALPVLAFCAWSPLPFDHADVVTKALTAFQYTWLMTFKVLGLCLNRGPLCGADLTLPQFLVAATLPITPTHRAPTHKAPGGGRLSEVVGSSGELLLLFYGKVIGLWGAVTVLMRWAPPPLTIQLTLAYAVGLYLFIGLLMDGAATFLSVAFGLTIAPHFDAPFLATGIANFWGCRWNLTAGNALRFLVYEPLAEGRLVRRVTESPALDSAARRYAGQMLSFVVSGLMHELVWWYVTGHATRGLRWLLFFSMQGPAAALEAAARGAARRAGRPLPRWATTVAAWVFLLGSGHLLFIAPCVEDGVAQAVVANLADVYRAVQDGLVKLYMRPVPLPWLDAPGHSSLAELVE